MKKDYLGAITKVCIFPVLVLIIHVILSLMFDIYNRFEWFDMPMHFAGGLSIGVSFSLLLMFFLKEKLLDNIHVLLFFVFVVSMVAITAVGWEFFEFLLKIFFDFNTQPSVADTMLDLFLGILGGIISCLFMIYKKGVK